MQKLIITTFVLRVLGLALIVLGLSGFGHNLIYNTFPGLEGYSLNPVCYAGIVIYVDRRREEIEDAEERAFQSSNKNEGNDA